jgi:hypothetical protein
MVPDWLRILSLIVLASGVISALWIVFDVMRHPQKMWIMNVVWPVTALFGSLLMVWAYFRIGRIKAEDVGSDEEIAFPLKVMKGALHCGSGCTLGDIAAEGLLLLIPGLAVVFGLGWLFDQKIFASWVLDYILAFIIGVAFQYFTIVPMRKLPPGKGVIAAVKADAASLTAWQVGMYGFMAIAHFWLFGALLGVTLEASMPEFWFMMQIAMLCGFITAYPVNWWLIRAGLKEAM